MTPNQIQRLQHSFAMIEPVNAQVAGSFYQKLTELAPDTSLLLHSDDNLAWRRFMGVFQRMVRTEQRSFLAVPVTCDGSKEVSLPGVAELAQLYANRGARPEHFDAAKEALLWSLDAHLGPSFDEATAEAWTSAYDVVAASIVSILNSEAVEAELPQAHGRSAPESGEESLAMLFNR